MKPTQMLFIARARRADAEVVVCKDADQIRREIRRRAAAGPISVLPAALAAELGIESQPPDTHDGAVVVTEADLAVAATGSVLDDATDLERRRAMTAADLHVIVVRPNRIVPDLEAALAEYADGPPPYLALSTGPSRTGDIEATLTIGVHGPRQVLIIVVSPGGDGGE